MTGCLAARWWNLVDCVKRSGVNVERLNKAAAPEQKSNFEVHFLLMLPRANVVTQMTRMGSAVSPGRLPYSGPAARAPIPSVRLCNGGHN